MRMRRRRAAVLRFWPRCRRPEKNGMPLPRPALVARGRPQGPKRLAKAPIDAWPTRGWQPPQTPNAQERGEALILGLGAPAHDPPKAAQSGPGRRPPMLLGGILAWRPKPPSGRAAPRPRRALSRRRRAPEKPSQPRLLPFHTRASRATAMATRLLLTVSALTLGGRRGSEEYKNIPPVAPL